MAMFVGTGSMLLNRFHYVDHILARHIWKITSVVPLTIAVGCVWSLLVFVECFLYDLFWGDARTHPLTGSQGHKTCVRAAYDVLHIFFTVCVFRRAAHTLMEDTPLATSLLAEDDPDEAWEDNEFPEFEDQFLFEFERPEYFSHVYDFQ